MERSNFFESMSVSRYLRPILKMLENSTSKLSSILSTYPPDYGFLFSKSELIRLLFSEELEKFSVLLNQYNQTAILDSTGMKFNFLNFT